LYTAVFHTSVYCACPAGRIQVRGWSCGTRVGPVYNTPTQSHFGTSRAIAACP